MVDFKKNIAQELHQVVPSIPENDIYNLIEVPKNLEWGDYAFPCFRLSKEYKKAPQQIAESLLVSLDSSKYDAITPLGGYINFKLKKSDFTLALLNEMKLRGDNFVKLDIGENKNVIVEFSSTNIAKPFHIGHLRSTVIGNSLYRIYKALGYNVIAINHLGDYGTQFGKLIVAFNLWGDRETIERDPINELLKLYIRFHDEAKENPKLDDEARAIFTRLENNDKEIYDLWLWIKEASLNEFKRVYNLLCVDFDSWNGEAFYSDKMQEVIDILNEKNLLKESDGAQIVDLEEFGMPPALITKKDGSTLYMTRDIAAAIYRKKTYDFYKNIYVVAYQQDLHFRQWFKVLELMGKEYAKDCVHVNFGLISLAEGTIATREGRVVFLEDVLNKAIGIIEKIIEEKNPTLPDKQKVARQVGVGAIVFQDLFNARIKDYVFDWDRALSFEGESGPYVQYAHARACSLIEKSQIDVNFDIDHTLIEDEASMDLIKTILNFEQIIIDASRDNEPYRITRYCVYLAQSFNKYYQTNKINVDDIELKKARLSLVLATKRVLKNALFLVGLQAPEQM